MLDKISIFHTDLLLRYLNCLERVFFIENKWMKSYNSLKNDEKKEYESTPLYLHKLITGDLDKDNQDIFKRSLPDAEDIKKYTKELGCIILDSEEKSFFISDEEDIMNYVVVACPSIEKIFHFKTKTNFDLGDPALLKAKIKDFFYHPDLPRVKIYSRNFETSSEQAKLSDLQFIYTNPGDASLRANSLKIVDNKIVWDELVPDPFYGVQIGNLALYFISAIKIKQLKRNIDNTRQLILVCEDFIGKEYLFYITTTLFRKLYNETPEEKVYTEPRYLRALIFQGFGEDFRHILRAENIDKEEFKSDSFLSHIRFRKVVSSEDVKVVPNKIPSQIEKKEDNWYYFPNNYKSEIIENIKKFKSGDTNVNYKLLRDYDFFFNICRFHKGWLESYENNKAPLEEYIPVQIAEPNPYGLHRDLLKDPLTKFIFFSKNKVWNINCSHCNEFQDKLKAKDFPNSCSICNAKVFEPEFGFTKEEKNRLGSLYLSFGKYLYYTLAYFGRYYSLNTCVKILSELKLKNYLNDEELFFDKLFKIKESYDRSYDIHNILYRIEKNEV